MRTLKVSVLVCFVLATAYGSVFWSSPALASNCTDVPDYCHYHLYGNSGAGADGTGGEITLPNTMYNMSPYTGNTVAFMIWMWGSDNTGGFSSIETGMVYGNTGGCDTYESYFHPYGTKDDGQTEVDDCGYIGHGGTAYQLWSFHPGGGSTAYSQVDVNGTFVWHQNWGVYTDGFGYDNQSWTEVYGLEGQPTPYWSLNAYFFNLTWENGQGNWYSWGYVSITNDCPYHGVSGGNNSWTPEGYSCNGGQPS